MPRADGQRVPSSSTMRHLLRELALAGVVIAAILGATTLLLLAGGYPVGAGLTALWTGSFGSWYAISSATLVRAVPLVLTGGAVALAFRAGVLNIGAEGQLLVGAAAAASVALAVPLREASPWLTFPMALGAAAVGGAIWAGVAAHLRTRYGVLEVISTIMLNFVALYGVSYLVRGPLQEPTRVYPQSPTIADALHLPRIASAGRIDVARTTTHAFMTSGALAGLAGGVEVLGVTFALYENISPGYGYTAIAVALLARLDPWRVLATAVLFGALEAGASAMQRDASVPSTLVSVIEAALILAVVAAQAIRVRRMSSDSVVPPPVRA